MTAIGTTVAVTMKITLMRLLAEADRTVMTRDEGGGGGGGKYALVLNSTGFCEISS